MATAAKTELGFSVVCPFCGDREAAITINLNDLTTCRCDACDEEFTPREALEQATRQMERWARVVRWFESASELASEIQ
jgi:hypothetical protein